MGDIDIEQHLELVKAANSGCFSLAREAHDPIEDEKKLYSFDEWVQQSYTALVEFKSMKFEHVSKKTYDEWFRDFHQWGSW